MALAATIINGLLVGGMFALAAVGFSLIFGVMDVINLTHGVILLLGAYVSYFAWQMAGIDPFLTIPLSMGALFVFGYVYQRVLVQRVIGEGALKSLLVTFAVALMIRNLMNVFWSSDFRSISPAYAGSNFQLVGVTVPFVRAVGLVIALALVAALALVLARTELGRSIRATAMDRKAAALMGVDVKHTFALTFGIAAAFSASAGSILGIVTPFSPVQEGVYTLQAFVVVVLGGVGTPLGALVGGLFLGLATQFTAAYLGSGFQQVVMFLLLVVMLLVRPHGLLGAAFSGGEEE
jgi:branched-chain amino acid transport system permease protein